MGNAVEFLGELISFMTSFLTTKMFFGFSLIDIVTVFTVTSLVISMILGRAKIYKNKGAEK